MPSTVNGIGTMYYGSGNKEAYHATCEHCHREATLSDYDTRLWFTILFIPIIPLARKRILGFCPLCTRHRAMNHAEWEQMKEEVIRESKTEFSENRDDPEAAVKMHASLAAFNERQNAAEMAALMQKQFSDNIDVQLYLGAWHAESGNNTEADACFDRALELDPENLGARRGVGVGLIEKGRLDEARKQLSAFAPPSEHYDPALFILLGRAYQGEQRHDEAMQMFELVVKATPELASDKELGKIIRTSEAALGRAESITVKAPVYKRKGLVAAAAVLLLIAGLAVYNYHVSQNRTLHVVNGLPVPISVDISGKTVQVSPSSYEEVEIAEGSHQARLIEPKSLAEPIDFKVEAAWHKRFLAKPAYVLDPARCSFVVWEQATYVAKPVDDDGGRFRLYIGEPFTTYESVDYVFEQFPPKIEIEGSGSKATRDRVGFVNMHPMQVMTFYPDRFNKSNVLAFLERHITATPGDESLLSLYVNKAAELKTLDQCLGFLKAGLARRPVAPQWHRLYQEVSQQQGSEKLVDEYDQQLRDDPQNSMLLYLRGRLEARSVDALKYCDQAIQADKENGFAWSAKAFHLSASGDFAKAETACQQAISLREDADVASLCSSIRFALGQHEALIDELNGVLGKEPLNFAANLQRLDLLAAQDRLADAETANNKFAAQLQRTWPDDPHQIALMSRLRLLYLKRDLPGIIVDADRVRQVPRRNLNRFLALLEMGKLDEAAAIELDPTEAGFLNLCLAIAWRQKGDAEKASQWRDRAIEHFAAGPASSQLAAELLKDGTQQSALPAALQLAMQPQWKAVVLVALAQQSQAARAELLALAEKLNGVQRSFPHYFVRDSITAMR